LKVATNIWTNASVLKFAAGRDPVQAVVQMTRDVVLEAIDKGWKGPPFDPMKLAEIRRLAVSPRGDIQDARTVPAGQNRFLIEYNPMRPNGRLRYSIAHEIAHTFFPDCGERVRNRAKAHGTGDDEWQLEALCNIAAAEILMPIGSFGVEELDALDINKVSEVRKKFDVSTEAVLIRLAHLSDQPCAVFVASRWDGSRETGAYHFDYVINTRSWAYDFSRGTRLPDRSPIADCTAIGFTAKGEVEFPRVQEKLHMECIGIPPYPGAVVPRVAGFLSSQKRGASSGVEYLLGSALEPRGNAPKLVAHVVSDATSNWGGRGFAIALKKKWPNAQEAFRTWTASQNRLQLGQVHFCEVEPGIEVASMICQHGYGPSTGPRLRYAALESGLQSLVTRAKAINASIHMPRIGTGQAGGSWMMVQELISSTLLAANLSVTIYDLPEGKPIGMGQMSLTAAQ
jgi:Zn-dependent peptidase ImmA (M78 family)